MRPKNWMLPPSHLWDDPSLGMGSVQTLTAGGAGNGRLVANLYVPEAESPTGWRDYLIYAPAPEPKPGQLGFHG